MDYVALTSVSSQSFSAFDDSLIRFITIFARQIEIGQLYAIAGNSQKVGLCQYIKEYSKMSTVEKRGIAGAYKKGCSCEVSSKACQKSFIVSNYHSSSL